MGKRCDFCERMIFILFRAHVKYIFRTSYFDCTHWRSDRVLLRQKEKKRNQYNYFIFTPAGIFSVKSLSAD